MITRNFKLCLNAGTALAPYINVNQYDHGEQWVFTLYNEDGTIYTPSTGAIIGIKADGRAIANAGSVVDGKVVINETEQMTAAAGRAIYELLIDGETHGTANFVVNVERRPADNADLSESDISLLQEAIDAAEVINEVIGEGGDPSELITENVNNWLDTHPEATTTVQDGAITAPKINQSLWDKLLVNEEASGNPASFDDGADDVPVSSLKVALEPIQTGSGDPSPSNIRLIVASNGKNLFQIASGTKTQNGVTWVVDGNGTITSSGISTATSFSSDTESVSLPSGTYTASVIGQNANIAMTLAKDGSWFRSINAGGTYTFTLNAPATITGYCQIATGLDASGTTYIMLEEGSSASPYQPYQGIMVDVTGENVLDPNIKFTSGTYNGITLTTTDGYTYTRTGTATSGGNVQTNNIALADAVILPAGTYTSVGGVFSLYKANGSFLGNKQVGTWTVTEPFFVKGIYFETVTGITVNYTGFIALAKGSTAPTKWSPYQSTSYPYTLGQSVYGGTVDLATGVLTVTHNFITLNGQYNINKHNISSYDGYYMFLTSNGLPKCASTVDGTKGQFNMLKLGLLTSGNGCGFVGNDTIQFRMDGGGTSADVKTWLETHPVQVVYPLETPTTVQLTPTEVKTLLGYNNISSSGTVDVIYHADTKLYVDKMTAVDNNIIAPTEADFVATRNYTVNDLVIVNDTLYKATSNIANGGTITPNSNVTQTTLGALIKALS